MDSFDFAANIDKNLKKKSSLDNIEIRSFMQSEVKSTSYLSLVGNDEVFNIDLTFSEFLPEFIIIDVGRLQRALRSLLSNAFEHSIPRSQISADVAFNPATKVIGFVVSNTISIDLKIYDVEHYFQQMYHTPYISVNEIANDESLSSTQGLGLGLYIAHKIIVSLGSKLEFTCISLTPSTFTVTFRFDLLVDTSSHGNTGSPIHVNKKQLRAPSTKYAQPSDPSVEALSMLGSRNILVVDDSPVCRKLLTKILTNAHFTCQCASNGEEAVAMMQSCNFSAVFMDLRMPIKDGIQATKEARAFGIRVPIIALSAESAQETKDQALAAGVDSFITKPMKADEILRELSVFLPLHPNSCSVKVFEKTVNESDVPSRNILVVDDSPVCRKLLIKILIDADFKCLSAGDGEEAIQMMKATSFCAVFMDVQMPIKNGIQATKEAREFGIRVPIIAMSTAESSPEIKHNALDAGCDSFILKPLQAEQILVELLRQFI